MILLNKPHISKNGIEYLREAIFSDTFSGNNKFTKKCHKFLEDRYGFQKILLTTSCTDALEMSSILVDIKPGDEVIMPSYTFPSTANAFILRGAKIIFADSEEKTPNIDADKIEELINEKTKVIVPVHYSGISCEMDKIMEIAKKYKLYVIEDAAQAINSYYKNKPLGSIGHLAAFSFQETKNISSGEGGAIVINDKQFNRRAEIVWEKGTNRAEFYRGEVDKYGWIDIGSSFLPSDMVAAFLYAQLEDINYIHEKRLKIWNHYYDKLKILEDKKLLKLPHIPEYASNNAHIFYLVCPDSKNRDDLLKHLKNKGILAVFHYISLHKSLYYKDKYEGKELFNCDKFSDGLIRLPLHTRLEKKDLDYIIETLLKYYKL